jgi:hypothetical protein
MFCVRPALRRTFLSPRKYHRFGACRLIGAPALAFSLPDPGCRREFIFLEDVIQQNKFGS